MGMALVSEQINLESGAWSVRLRLMDMVVKTVLGAEPKAESPVPFVTAMVNSNVSFSSVSLGNSIGISFLIQILYHLNYNYLAMPTF